MSLYELVFIARQEVSPVRAKELAKNSAPKMKVFTKIPITKNGIKAAKKLIESKVPVTFTACFEVEQILNQAKSIHELRLSFNKLYGEDNVHRY